VNSATIDLDNYCPEDPTTFGLWIEFSAGGNESSGADDFRIYVCSPNWLDHECAQRSVIWGRHLLITQVWNIAMIREHIESMLALCEGLDWQSLALQISRFAAWEFEDYSS